MVKRNKIGIWIPAVMAMATMLAADAGAQQSRQVQGAIPSPLEPVRQSISQDQLFSELQAHNEQRKSALLGYTVRRTYRVSDVAGKVHAEETGRMEFRAPDQKTFEVSSESGSNLIRHLALSPLISSEIETTAGKEHHDSAISPANYQLNLVGEQQLGPYHCFVVDVLPRRKDKYLFEGRAWIDAEDYAIVRIEGHPAKKLSFWIERAEFIRQYQKVDGFWLPQRDETTVHVRLYGDKKLTIDHADYAIRALRNGGLYASEATARVAANTNGNPPGARNSSRFLQNKKGVE